MSRLHQTVTYRNGAEAGMADMSVDINAAFPLPRAHEVGVEAAMQATVEYARALRERIVASARRNE